MDAMLCCPEKYEYTGKHVRPFIKKQKENKNKKYPTLPRQQKKPKGMGNPNTKLLLIWHNNCRVKQCICFCLKTELYLHAESSYCGSVLLLLIIAVHIS